MNSDDDSASGIIDDETATRLQSWQADLSEMEGEELADDVVAVGRLMPHRMMTDLESWIEDADFDETLANEDLVLARFSSWLIFLDVLQETTTSDPSTRGSFSSYVRCTGAIRFILNASLLFLPIDRNGVLRKTTEDVPTRSSIVTNESSFTASFLSQVLLFRTAEVLPTLTKQWWDDDCPKSLQAAVSEFVEKRVTPGTLRSELQRISRTDLGDLSVTGSLVSREVTASYEQDECQLSVVISVPANFPLRNVEVDGRKTLGVPETRWKRWALQIRVILNNQDGNLLDALQLWKNNVDKEFEGVEPCPVCYSVLSVKTYELPTLECKTCHHRFHSSCLYTWFRTSGKSQCVLCQQPWSGTRVK